MPLTPRVGWGLLVSVEFHLHWRRTSSSFWMLHLAQVRLRPKHLEGVTRLSVQRLVLRRAVGASLSWYLSGFASSRWPSTDNKGRYFREHVVAKGGLYGVMEELEVTFQAHVAAMMLGGKQLEMIQTGLHEVCQRCPPSTIARMKQTQLSHALDRNWREWDHLAYEMRWELRKINHPRGKKRP